MNEVLDQIGAVFWNMWNRPDIMDFVDIILLAIIIYELLIHVRQTRVSQTLKGIVIFLIITWASGVLGMRSIHALLTWVVNAGPVMVVVLFQSEIRRILEELGNGTIWDSGIVFSDEEMKENLIDEMILAVTHMSKRRVGALIVIENKTRLDDVIDTGTRIDGMISQPLIENIFEPKTPLHDGAVVIRGDRVVSAACLLRLSDTTGVGRDLGTRHRAGIGVSEVSDATVIIVSEETGAISIAERGNLTRNLSEQALRGTLHSLFDSEEKNRRLLPLFRSKNSKEGGQERYDEQPANKKK